MGCVDLTEQNHGVQKGSSQPCPKSVEADIMKINGTANKGDGSNDRITEKQTKQSHARHAHSTSATCGCCRVGTQQHDTNSILLNSYI